MSEDAIELRVRLEGDMAKRFLALKSKLGFESNTDLVRMIIMKQWMIEMPPEALSPQSKRRTAVQLNCTRCGEPVYTGTRETYNPQALHEALEKHDSTCKAGS